MSLPRKTGQNKSDIHPREPASFQEKSGRGGGAFVPGSASKGSSCEPPNLGPASAFSFQAWCSKVKTCKGSHWLSPRKQSQTQRRSPLKPSYTFHMFVKSKCSCPVSQTSYHCCWVSRVFLHLFCSHSTVIKPLMAAASAQSAGKVWGTPGPLLHLLTLVSLFCPGTVMGHLCKGHFPRSMGPVCHVLPG